MIEKRAVSIAIEQTGVDGYNLICRSNLVSYDAKLNTARDMGLTTARHRPKICKALIRMIS